jgi:FtsP/CotA-like multicopper oxidase with cupredoxin domain
MTALDAAMTPALLPRRGTAGGLLARMLPSGRSAAVALALTLWVGAVLQLAHAGQHERHELSPVLHWLRDSALAYPVALLAAVFALHSGRRLLAWAQLPLGGVLQSGATAVLGGVAFALLSVPGSLVHGALFGASHEGMTAGRHAGYEASLVLLSATALLAALPTLSAPLAAAARRLRALVPAWANTSPRLAAGGTLVAAAAILAAGGAGGGSVASAGAGVCPSDARQITYDVSAFETVIPLNGWGDHLPSGLVYALRGADARVGKDAMLRDPNLTQPLVIRANVGDCVTVKLRNDVNGRRVGMHTDGLVRMDPKDTDGTRVGFNPDSTVAAGQEISYTWYADREGEAPIVDAANLDAAGGAVAGAAAAEHVEGEPEVEGPESSHSSIERGLYGAVVVHPKGSTWHNPTTGQDMLAGNRAVETQVFADVRNPTVPDFRSFTLVMLDENADVRDRNGATPTFPTTGLEDSSFGFNYRSEPLRNRLRAIMEHREGKTVTLPSGKVIQPTDHFCDGFDPEQGKVVDDPGAKCLSEESHLQSWVFGDEGKLVNGQGATVTDLLIPKAYKGDPVKYHLIHPGAKESHPFHHHTMRWYADPGNKKSSRNDVQLMGPGESRLLDIEGGAGSVTGTIGDSIFHCHLYPHFAQGFWGHMRIFDRLRDGTQKYPDGTQLQKLQDLPDRAGQTPAPDATHPGYPLFVKGDVGQRAYRPPFAVVKDDFAALRRKGDAPRTPTALEQANLPALSASKPGAAYVDPCPTGLTPRVYRPHAIDAPITFNSAGWKDPEARMFVEESQVAAVRAGTKQPEPYTIRARVGECVEVRTTNDLHLDDNPAVPLDRLNKKDGTFMKETATAEISTHVHLVKFDELGSDGTSVGWNYVQAAMPGQTYAYRWFIDQPLRTVFFHDHQYANLHQQKGLFAALNVEPKDATWHDPRTGLATDGTGTVADIRSASGPDFREFSVFQQDRVPMWRADGRPVDPPSAPDDYGADQGGMAINYRNEPFQIRTQPGAAGPKGDPAYTFSSAVHGDPSTPVFRAYPRDPVVIRNVVGSHEEIHTFNVHGHRWLSEPDNPNSAPADTQTLSLAEFANYEFTGSGLVRLGRTQKETLGWAMNGTQNGIPNLLLGGASRPGDYMYGETILENQWLGLWGIFRVPQGSVADLKPLPDKPAPVAAASPWPALRPGAAVAPPPATGEAATCPATAPARTYAISAMTKDIVYNAETGDHDPVGLFYALNEDVAAIEAGTKRPEPLFIRANAGDCVKVTLTNRLPAGGLPAHSGDLPLPANAPFPASNRVSIHPNLTRFDVTRSDGATVGYNHDQTVAPGASRTYTWYLDPEVTGATINLVDMADRRGHRHHGLWGGLMVEPKGSTWLDPVTGAPLKGGAGAAAVIKWTEAGVVRRQREFVVDFQDGLNLKTPGGAQIPPASPADDPYDAGNRGINYRTERFAPRLADNPEMAWVMSSTVHGDPATPVFRAYKGDPVRFRVLMGGDRGRAHSWLLHGHRWANQPSDPASMQRTNRGNLIAGESFVADLIGGAGGAQAASGDYLFRDGNLINQVNAGLWGIFRVHDAPVADLKPLAGL